jgi:hypothetical protein
MVWGAAAFDDLSWIMQVRNMMLCRFRHVSFVGEFFQFSYSNISINKQIINLNKEVDGYIFLISRRQTSVLNDMQ